MNDKLFSRIKYLYENKDKLNLDGPQQLLVTKTYKLFVRNGALLSASDKETLKSLNVQLTDLIFKFNKNVLNATNEFAIFIENEADLASLSSSTISNALEEAKNRGQAGKWAFTLHAPVRLDVLQHADNREFRRKMYESYTTLCTSGAHDNRPIIQSILKARYAKATLLGFSDFASYQLDAVMAKTPQNAIDTLMTVWRPALKKVTEEVAEMQRIVDGSGGGFRIAPYDYYYYSGKVRLQKYNISESVIRPFFSVDAAVKGIFTLAKRLYGVTFRELPNAPKYHPDVRVYEALDEDGKHLAVFMTDYFMRSSKQAGACMDVFREAYIDLDGTEIRPIVFNVANFEKPSENSPSLLTLDDVQTVFHEFGHALHGMLTKAKYVSQAGTNVDRDFVELPSQINEHWAIEPELLKEYAHHYKTNEEIPEDIVQELMMAPHHNAGFNMVELVGASLLDLMYHLLKEDEINKLDIEKFEKDIVNKFDMPEEVQFRYHSTYFKHIFGMDSYASGYYTYTWAEVLDTDAFELFKEKGVFDKETANSFRKNILEKGGSDDPMNLFISFRGRKPSPEALLRHYGLI